MKKHLLAIAVATLACGTVMAQANDTIAKAKSTGVVTDGPFMEAKELLGGYSIIKADSYEQALAIAKECPAHQDGSSIEVRELAGLAG